MTELTWLILPTYNEAENIEAIVTASAQTLAACSPNGFRILIVDDDSPDGTGQIGERLASERSEVEILHRAIREGLGPAYLAGFEHALSRGADFIMEMDSDFSHSPSDLERLLRTVRDGGADLALGSRYVPGGGIENWSASRRVISRGGSLYARIILSLPVTDLTGGFKCFRREVLETIDLDSIRSVGYGFQIELTWRAFQAGFVIGEVPIVFLDRQVGESKMSPRIMHEAMLGVLRMRLR